MNRLFFGDNLGWLRDPKEFPDESVDLVYLDPQNAQILSCSYHKAAEGCPS
ncbi:MAG: hypothetical protein HY298_20390 [Verrucomicrobia bacterium]|nr:hypothetical protein [Verrucomicrobiota bacterium]